MNQNDCNIKYSKDLLNDDSETASSFNSITMWQQKPNKNELKINNKPWPLLYWTNQNLIVTKHKFINLINRWKKKMNKWTVINKKLVYCMIQSRINNWHAILNLIFLYITNYIISVERNHYTGIYSTGNMTRIITVWLLAMKKTVKVMQINQYIQ